MLLHDFPPSVLLDYFNYDRHSIVSEGGNHSWSQQMKEQQQSVLANQDRELNPEDVSLSHHNQPQELLQPDPLCENHSHVPQARNSITEPENPQPQLQNIMSLQRTHGVEQPVGSGPTHLQVCELIRILIPQVDKDKGNQLPSLYYKFKVGFYIHGMTRLSHPNFQYTNFLFTLLAE